MSELPVQPGEDAIVRLERVHKRFDSLVVLEDITVSFRRGETTVIIGESGTGKSVLLKHIVRLLRPDAGAVYFDGRRVDQLPERLLTQVRSDIGFLFQQSALFDSMTVWQNVAFPVVEHGRRSHEEVDRIVREKLTMVGLDGVQQKWPSELSGGQKKRVALARAIALSPRLILYDEPTTGLDPPRADVINELILKLQRELNVTSIVVTHDMASAMKVADRVLMLYKGGFIFDGAPDDLLRSEDERVRYFVEGRSSREDLESLKVQGEA